MSSGNSSLKPIKLYSHASGPNPWRVAMVMKALDIPYTTEFVDFSKIKEEPFITVNPNGRVPAITDDNTGMNLWESGAILQYLVATYDKSHSISFPAGSKAFHEMNQWLFFQASGQGPYYGQSAWFQRFHHEKLPSAIARYQKEVNRVVGVIDLHLSKTGQQYLVADDEHKEGKVSAADIAFVPWGVNAPYLADGDLFEGGKNQKYKEWMDRVTAQKYVSQVLKEKEEVGKQH